MTRKRVVLLFVLLIFTVPLVVYKSVVFRLLGRPRIVWQYRGTVWVNPGRKNLALAPDQTLYVQTDHLEVVDRQGVLKWQSRQYGLPAIARDGTAYVWFMHDSGFALRALGPDGQELWTSKIDGKIPGLEQPEWITGISLGPHNELYTGGYYLRGFHPDGSMAWQLGEPTDKFFYSRPLVGSDGTIYVARSLGIAGDPGFRVNLLAVAPDGNELWNREIYDNFAHFLPAPDHRVLAVNFNGSVYPGVVPHVPGYWISSSGETAEVPKALQEQKYMVLTARDVYVIGFPERLQKISYSGSLQCETRPFNVASVPVVARDGTVYVGDDSGLLAFASNCWQAWRLEFGTKIRDVILGDDGSIYALGEDGIVRTIHELFGNGGLRARGWPDQTHDSRNSNSAAQE